MKFRRKWVLLAAGVIVLVALVVFAVIKDRAAALSPAEAQARQLIAELQHQSTLERWLDRLGLKKTRRRRPPNEVIDDLAAVGTPAIRPLIEALQARPESGVKDHSAAALARIGRPAVPALVKVLDDRRSLVRIRAAFALGAIGPDAKQAVERLLEMLKNDMDWGVRSSAAQGLGGIGRAAAPAVPALIDALKDSEWYLRRSAAWALGDLGPTAKAAVPALEKALKDGNENVRQAAAEALKKIQPVSSP